VIFRTAGSPIKINAATRPALFQALRRRITRGDGFALATLNLDHLTKLPKDQAFARAYAAQDLVVADGRPVTWLCRLAGQQVALIPGSDLIIPLCKLAAELNIAVALVGSSEDTLARAAAVLTDRVPGLVIGFSHAPPYGFDPQSASASAVLRDLGKSGSRLCLVALGAPKQELFAARGRALLPEVGFASIGAGLDFIAGQQRRAPRIMRILPLEWFWRLLQDPRRMAPRYAKCFAILPGLIGSSLQQRFR
jgi:N-acetylglucosaminyldiphosphoundecaprenol N-acetyl-beta-D-mannosaminyltransferase